MCIDDRETVTCTGLIMNGNETTNFDLINAEHKAYIFTECCLLPGRVSIVWKCLLS